MKNVTSPILINVLLAVVFLAGCAKAPTAELESASMALDSAAQADADLFVVDLYQAAQDSFAAAQAEIEIQNAKMSLTRNYDRATELIQYAEQTAKSAAEQVESRKEAMRLETQTLITEAQTTLAAAKELMSKAPRGKEGNIALIAIGEDTGTAESNLNEAVTALEQGDIVNAHTLAQTALEKAKSLVEELNQAISAKAAG